MAVDRRTFLRFGAVLAAVAARLGLTRPARAAEPFPVGMSDAAWRQRLDPQAYRVLRRAGTERPYSSPLNREHRPGRFACAGCGAALFSSDTKFDSHTGWPSFFRPIPAAVGESRDWTLGIPRTEVHCATCGGHLGHVFADGPRPTGLRYCMNGAAMRFEPGAA
jgi:peptide-methionine (R)-S-oxide reductase